MDAQLQPLRVDWDAAYETGHAELDAQHRALLALCNALADRCGPDAAPRFDDTLRQLRTQAEAHFAAELAWRQAVGDPDLDDHRADGDEFGFLVQEIATPAHFDRVELQRFLALWWLGHVAETAPPQRALQGAGGAAPAA
jgi:hemerythrin